MDLESKAVWLEAKSDVRLVATAASVEEYLTGAPKPEIVTLDLHLGNGTLPADNVTALVRAGHKVIVLTVLPEKSWINETTEAGAAAYLNKTNNLNALVSTIRELHSGNMPTTADHAFWLSRDDRPTRPHLSPGNWKSWRWSWAMSARAGRSR